MLTKIIKITLIAFFLLFPLFFLRLTADSYEYNKMALLIFFSLVLLVLLSLKIAQDKKISFCIGSFGLPLILIAFLCFASSLFQSQNLMLVATTPLSTTTIIFGTLLYLVLVNIFSYSLQNYHKESKEWVTRVRYPSDVTSNPAQQKGDERQDPLGIRFGNTTINTIFNILTLDAAILAIYVIFLYTQILPESQYTPAGTLLSTATFLFVMLVYLILKTISIINRGEDKTFEEVAPKGERVSNQLCTDNTLFHERVATSKKLLSDLSDPHNINSDALELKQINLFLHGSALFLILVALILLVYHLTDNQPPAVLPFSYGWMIFVEILKNVKTIIFGVGMTNFQAAYTLTKPISVNYTPYWNVVFTSSSSFFLNLATEAGIIAGILYLYIFLKAAKQLFSILHSPFSIFNFPLFFSLLILILLPGNMTLFILTIILLAVNSKTKPLFILDLKQLGWIVYVLVVPYLMIILMTTAAVFYFGGKIYLAEIYFKKSLDAMVSKRGTESYNYQTKAVELNPSLDRYHLSLSQTSLALADALSAKKELSQDDKQNIPKLIQQSINEARLTVALNRISLSNWDNLGFTYSALINFAKGSDDWAVKSYEQKIFLDPAGPSSRFTLGKLYFSMKLYPEAENLLLQAVSLKNDFANARYLLAQTYKAENKNQEAREELEKVLSLLDKNSDDAKRVEKELKEAFSSASPTPASIIPSPLPNITLPEPPLSPNP